MFRAWPESVTLAWLGLDRQSRILAFAIAVSVLLHGVVLSIHFQLPDGKRLAAMAPMEVVIVNSKSRSRPTQAQVLAQANLDGGGNTDERRRARSPLPTLSDNRPGDDVRDAQRRVQELEAQQRQLLTQVAPQAAAAPSVAARTPVEPQREARGADLRDTSLALVRSLEAQVSRQIDEYNQRPKKTFIGARATEFRFAQYVEDWRLKIERIGTLNYPDGARGRIYGSLRLSVAINADGTLNRLDVERSSGQPILDQAAEKIVKMSAPYARFPDNIRRDTDILVITRTWNFAQGDRVFAD
ncbi:MAG: energy transducer TonB [Betaproteobacteria bacterium RIFCSPLOWO2_02_FULL_62_17]|nr:MAG: energy transducer TonB [Betaproteobacteria bacterium RIFCSPLOWO2_02_FULL_62_17]